MWRKYRETGYEVSNKGEVRNKKGKIMKQQDKKGYKTITLYIEGKNKKKLVHRMVAECFLNDYSEELEVNHKDSNRYNNNVSNLEMVTREENYQHSIKHGKGSNRKMVICYNPQNDRGKLYDSLWKASQQMIKENKTTATLDHISNNIRLNCQGKTKSAYGYIWKFII